MEEVDKGEEEDEEEERDLEEKGEESTQLYFLSPFLICSRCFA